MIIIKGNNLLIGGLSTVDREQIEKALTIPNPMFAKLQRMGNTRALYACPKSFKYFKHTADGMIIPRGSYGRLLAYLTKRGIDPKITDKTTSNKVYIQMLRTLPLREHQTRLVGELLKHREGVVEASMGSGKTLLGLELVYKTKQNTLILVDKKQLLNQWVSECKKFYGYTPGEIIAGKTDIREITVATWQSLPRVIHRFKDVGMVICDEAHGVVSDKRIEMLNQLSPKYLYGVTATAKRSKDDGKTEAIHFYLGEIVAKYQQDMLKPTVETIFTGCTYNEFEYQRLEEKVMEDENRNRLIKSLVMGEMLEGRKTLILTKRVAHYEKFREHFAEGSGVFFMDAKDKKTPMIIEGIRSGLFAFSAIFGTFSLLGTGIDIKTLDTLILGASVKSDVLTAQSCGRIK